MVVPSPPQISCIMVRLTTLILTLLVRLNYRSVYDTVTQLTGISHSAVAVSDSWLPNQHVIIIVIVTLPRFASDEFKVWRVEFESQYEK